MIDNKLWNILLKWRQNPNYFATNRELRDAIDARIAEVEGVLFVAGTPDIAGNILSEEALIKMADNVTRFWDAERKALIYRGPMPPHKAKGATNE